MIKLAQLHQFIQQLNVVSAEQLTSTADHIKIIPCGRLTTTPGEIIIAEKYYDAVYTLENYPQQRYSEDVLIAQVSAWLLTHDTDRTEGISYELIADVMDESAVDLEFTIAFVEHVKLVEAIDGSIDFDGTLYELA